MVPGEHPTRPSPVKEEASEAAPAPVDTGPRTRYPSPANPRSPPQPAEENTVAPPTETRVHDIFDLSSEFVDKMAALRPMNQQCFPAAGFQFFGQPDHAAGRNAAVLAANGEGDGHGESFGPELAAAFPVFVRFFFLRPAERSANGVLEILVFHVIGGAVHGHHAVNEVRPGRGISPQP